MNYNNDNWDIVMQLSQFFAVLNARVSVSILSVLFLTVIYIFAGAFVFRICAFVVEEVECSILMLKWDVIRTFDALR